MLRICRLLISAIVQAHIPSRRLRIVEFCAGSGFLGLPLAAMYPDIDVVLIDQKVRKFLSFLHNTIKVIMCRSKAQSLVIAKQRAELARLKNISFIEQSIETYDPYFDIGIGLHACGIATDIIIDK